MACDICGKTGTGLESLNDQFQTDDIKEICPRCARDVNDHLWKIRALTSNILRIWLKRFMEERKGKRPNVEVTGDAHHEKEQGK